MLTVIDEQGRAYNLPRLPHGANYSSWLRKFTQDQIEAIYEHLDSEISTQERFSCATLFGGARGDWEAPLLYIYQATGNETDSALLLGRMVLARIIAGEKHWLMTKTNLNGRELATAFYWN